MEERNNKIGMPNPINFFDFESNNKLSEKEKKILAIVKEKWPTTALEIAEFFNENLSSRENQKKASSKYAYYLRKLVEKQLILSKRVGNALVVWPIEAEKLKVVKSILKEE